MVAQLGEQFPEHVCDENCSKNVTPVSLRGMGYDMPDLRHDASVPEKIQHGLQFGRVKHQAWMDGKTRLCTKTERTAP